MLASRDQLLATHEQFQKLAQEHSQYEQRLSSLTHKRYLTDDEKLEEVRLKKLKLRRTNLSCVCTTKLTVSALRPFNIIP
ncbi:MAG: hypothetical protein DMG92_06380 [Acidobacteria bacterium]|nr:MAG: hypothetical protein DMG92_06380 [Acidobacteriota bacterium]